MSGGFLPIPGSINRNKPRIPTTTLPATGCQTDPPSCPYTLLEASSLWWNWAWRTPQACAWDDGSLYVVARRALLEDEEQTLQVLRECRELDDRLGLTPKGLAALRWKIVEDEEQTKADVPAPSRGRGLTVVPDAKTG